VQPAAPSKKKLRGVSDKEREAFTRILSAIEALVRQDRDVIWGSMVKQQIKRRHPEFNEQYYGFRSFSHLLQEAEKKKVIVLEKDSRGGGYSITLPD
jgi:endonuclease IV